LKMKDPRANKIIIPNTTPTITPTLDAPELL
jgi:hypothetical protein